MCLRTVDIGIGQGGQDKRAFLTEQGKERLKKALCTVFDAAERLVGGVHEEGVTRLDAECFQIGYQLFFGMHECSPFRLYIVSFI